MTITFINTIDNTKYTFTATSNNVRFYANVLGMENMDFNYALTRQSNIDNILSRFENAVDFVNEWGISEDEIGDLNIFLAHIKPGFYGYAITFDNTTVDKDYILNGIIDDLDRSARNDYGEDSDEYRTIAATFASQRAALESHWSSVA